MDQFAFSGYSMSNMLPCVIDGDTIYETNYNGARRAIGKTKAAYEELETTTKQYYDKLVELGIIVPPKSQEELMADMQSTIMSMSQIMSALADKVKELESNGHEQCACRSGEDVSKHQSKRGGAKSTAGDQRDGEQS